MDYAYIYKVYGNAMIMAALLIPIAVLLRGALVNYRDLAKLSGEENTVIAGLVNPLLAKISPRTDIEVRKLKARLQSAGWRDDGAIRRYGRLRIISLAAAVPAIAALWTLGLDVLMTMALSIGALLLGMQVPDYVLDNKIKERKIRIAAALPSMIDLLVLCLDVGLSLESAFDRVTIEMQSMEPILSEEASIMVGEIGAGLTFPQALRRMADRIGLEELVTLARLITQANALGASMSQALREYSEASFSRRVMQLEEHAGKVSALMIMPVTVCMLPAAMLALMGPAVISIYDTMHHM